ncbi:MAG: hypothetical protein LAT67_10680 [Balneolales bacterium]|nr:hypothetical protein [Balneolales bacterium]
MNVIYLDYDRLENAFPQWETFKNEVLEYVREHFNSTNIMVTDSVAGLNIPAFDMNIKTVHLNEVMHHPVLNESTLCLSEYLPSDDATPFSLISFLESSPDFAVSQITAKVSLLISQQAFYQFGPAGASLHSGNIMSSNKDLALLFEQGGEGIIPDIKFTEIQKLILRGEVIASSDFSLADFEAIYANVDDFFKFGDVDPDFDINLDSDTDSGGGFDDFDFSGDASMFGIDV